MYLNCVFFFQNYLKVWGASEKMTATAGKVLGVANGGNVAIGVSPAGTNASVEAGALVGKDPPPIDPGGMLPVRQFIVYEPDQLLNVILKVGHIQDHQNTLTYVHPN